MVQILSILKIVAILGVLGGIGFGAYKVYQFHLNEIEEAVALSQADFERKEKEIKDSIREELKETNRVERQRIERELSVEKQRVQDLERMLLIDHDLDRLLQRKPGLVLPRVNNGTQEVLEELGEITK